MLYQSFAEVWAEDKSREKYKNIEFIPLNKERILVGVIIIPSHNNKAIITYYEKKIIEFKYQLAGYTLPSREILKGYLVFL